MGSVFGVISEETPKYHVLATHATYEVRRYAAATAIEATHDPRAFMRLAGYIGVMTKPENAAQQKIAMTAPVVTTQGNMQFVLPRAGAGSPPAPTRDDVRVVPRDETTAAVATYFGRWDETRAEQMRDALVAACRRDGLDDVDAERWEWHRFNPPWTLPFCRKNEIYVPFHTTHGDLLGDSAAGSASSKSESSKSSSDDATSARQTSPPDLR